MRRSTFKRRNLATRLLRRHAVVGARAIAWPPVARSAHRRLRWCAALGRVLALCAWWAAVSLAQGPEPDLEVTIDALQATMLEGATCSWQVSLVNRSPVAIAAIQLYPVGQSWQVIGDPPAVEILEAGQRIALELATVPVTTGELYPAIGVAYTLSDTLQRDVAVAARPVQVQRLGSRIEARVDLGQSAARVGSPLPLWIWFSNRTPFTITGLVVDGIGTGLEWPSAIKVAEVQPGQVISRTMAVTVRSAHPRAAALFRCRWTDAGGSIHQNATIIEGEPIAMQQRWWKQLPATTITGLIGAWGGALAGLAPWAIRESIRRCRQRAANRSRVLGLLHMFCVEAEHGVDTGTSVSLKEVEQVFGQEGLYESLLDLKLVDTVQSTWKAAYEFNQGLHLPYGAERTRALRDSANQLRKHIKGINPHLAQRQPETQTDPSRQ